MTTTQYNRFQKQIDKAHNALYQLQMITLSDKDMNGTDTINQYDFLADAMKKIERVSVTKHESMENSNK
mgnify:CR=1 FL=1